MDPRLEVIQKMRNQEATSQYQLNQALRGTPYYSYGEHGKEMYYPSSRRQEYGLWEDPMKKESIGISSFKIRCMIAILLGIFLFSIHTSEKAEVVTKIVNHIGENQTIEDVMDQMEEVLSQVKRKP